MKDIHFYSGRLGNELFRDAYIYSQFRDGKIPDVYVQDYRLFEKYADELKERYGEGIGFLPYVSIHVRVGKNPANPDEPAYKDNPFYTNLLDTDYYDKATALFPGKKFLLFSDNPEYAKGFFWKEIEDGTVKVVEGGTELEDFNQMASCEHNIIANSSFSWWAAFLNMHPNKVVVAPKNWYADGQERTLLPPSWTRL